MTHTLASIDGDMIPIIAVGGGVAIAIIAIVFGSLKSILSTRSREATKRELAAYVAEGSVSPEDAERLLKSDLPHWHKGDRKA